MPNTLETIFFYKNIIRIKLFYELGRNRNRKMMVLKTKASASFVLAQKKPMPQWHRLG